MRDRGSRAPDSPGANELEIVHTQYDDPAAARLTAELQAEYVRRYGGPDGTPVALDEFEPPDGLFLVGYDAVEPVAMGGWRRHDPARSGDVPGSAPAEIKRMYVSMHARGKGHARSILAELEETSRACGADWLVLETGLAQPEAIKLYRSSGYFDIPAFGHYRDAPLAVHLGKPLHRGSRRNECFRPSQ
jgi:ribosomal protein S18 acetylase RimI-like enzyme